MLTYGDGLSDVNINDLVKFHKNHKKIGTVTGVRPSGRFGEIEVTDGNQISEFNEKPQTTGGRINGGFFVFDSKRIWDYLPEGDDLNFERGPLRDLAKDGELMMFPHDGFWQPMDTYREYQLLNTIWEEGIKTGNIPWPGEKFR
jgi:glucose-1-phosphate cytidylyltransferase